MSSKFRNKSGLTAYALGCGYIQRAELKTLINDSRIDLYHEGACYHVRGYDFKESGRLLWECFESLAEARKAWASQVSKYYGERIAAAKCDARYRVTREFTGADGQVYVARFSGERLGQSDTDAGAWLIAYQDFHKRAADLATASDDTPDLPPYMQGKPRLLTFEQAKARYVYRYTCDHKPAWADNPIRDMYPAPQYRSDREWYENTAFPGEEGNLAADTDGAYSTQQTWPLGRFLIEPFDVRKHRAAA